ncbi:uncharacterized protein LOC117653702 [Thrips palmi]|uniref:Uncharacterized protein LOC117653702 n=1 Tax=Thrips palmi TaxID=161013 RepID=A0A6P9ABE7_THRPL|nr:uncharacterized protein LOC117653702 [Thrips palmi]
MKAALMEENADSKSCKITGMVLMTANFFKEAKESLIKLIEKTTLEEDVATALGGSIPPTPLLVVAGDCIFKPHRLFMCMDGTVCGCPLSLLDGVCMLFAAYYVFNLQYDAKAQITLEFLQRCVMGINPEKGNKRPGKVDTLREGGRYSSTREHQALSSMSLSLEEFLAEKGSDVGTEDSEEL